jgi:mono/diheme cytochrome c family protein
MTPVASATLGLVFLGLAFAATFLMFHLWGYPFDKTTRKSAAPRSLMYLHRVIGYSYAILYLFMMSHMVPRMWEYQVELPPRTVAHLLLGITIGVILIVKISIVRFFRHLEEWMPYLGTALLLCTVLLLGLSVPFAFRERLLASGAAGGDVFSASNRARVAQQLSMSELPADAKKMDLAAVRSLVAGRDVLLDKCVKCHDLKTILARPRSANDWFTTVERMAEKPALFAPINDKEVYFVSAYLVAITPDLQRSKKKQREQEEERLEAIADAEESMTPAPPPSAEPVTPAPEPTPTPTPVPPPVAKQPAPPPPDPKVAKATFARVCSQCHELSDVDDAPPKSEAAVGKLLARMIENGMTAKQGELRVVKYYLLNHYVKKTM